MNGVLLVNKPAGLTSHDVCFHLRRELGVKKTGHAGTLDPMATGVLVVLIGDAVRLSEYAACDEKEYVFDITFGMKTDTDDIWGRTVDTAAPEFTQSDFQESIHLFTGNIVQVPPAYSAVKINGKRSYRYAAGGVNVDLAARSVTIKELEILQCALPKSARIRTVCSKGTYIRALCRDIGEQLGCGAVMSALTRIRSGGFRIDQTYRMEDIEARAHSGEAEKLLLPTDSLIMQMKRSDVDISSLRFLINGNLLYEKNMCGRTVSVSEGEATRIYCGGAFCAVGKGSDGGIKPQKVFIRE